MWRQLKSWWRAEGDLATLRGLDDRMLADMGLDRAGLDARVHGRVDPEPRRAERYRHPLRRPVAD